MFPVTADSGECLPRQTMRLCSSEPLSTPCLCVHIGNISPPPREAVATPLTRNSFLPCPIQPIAFFVLRGMLFVRSYARAWWIIVRQILVQPFCVARLSRIRYVPRVAPEESADIDYALSSKSPWKCHSHLWIDILNFSLYEHRRGT